MTRHVSADTFDAGAQEPWVVLAARDDPALGETLGRLGRRTRWVGLLTSRGVVIAHGASADGLGCARCAWLGEREQVSDVPPTPVGGGAVRAARGWLRTHCAQLVDALLLGLEALPVGYAWVSAPGAPKTTQPIARHPACDCWHGGATVADVSWDALQARSFAPVWPVDRGGPDRAARVVFRRSARGEVVSAATLGVALGAGPEGRTFALAESIERSSMHHAPPSVRGATAQELGDRALPAAQISALLFRAEERSAPAFRFRAFDPSTRCDWVTVRSPDRSREALVPAALVGHVEAEQRFAAATSNGFACHRDEAAATLGALLELIERDAILVSWFLGRPWVRLTDVDQGGAVFLCTQDIDLPVVFACGCADDGSLRSGSAAALGLDAAIAHALRERRVALSGRSPPTGRPPLERADVLHGPEDHLARVSGAAGRRVYEALRDSATEARRDEVDRWARSTEAPDRPSDGVDTVVAALAARGLDAWVADRSLPQVFGAGWRVVRALVPGLVELSFGLGYRRLAGERIATALRAGELLNPNPHPFG